MSAAEWLQIATLIVAIVLVTRFLGAYLAKVYGGGTAPGDKVFGPIERGIYRVAGVDPRREQRWTVTFWVCWRSAPCRSSSCTRSSACKACCRATPTGSCGAPALSFNTAVSRQHELAGYSGESTISPRWPGSQSELRVGGRRDRGAVALIRGLVRRRATIKQVDLT